jgi:hypothetical protein
MKNWTPDAYVLHTWLFLACLMKYLSILIALKSAQIAILTTNDVALINARSRGSCIENFANRLAFTIFTVSGIMVQRTPTELSFCGLMNAIDKEKIRTPSLSCSIRHDCNDYHRLMPDMSVSMRYRQDRPLLRRHVSVKQYLKVLPCLSSVFIQISWSNWSKIVAALVQFPSVMFHLVQISPRYQKDRAYSRLSCKL